MWGSELRVEDVGLRRECLGYGIGLRVWKAHFVWGDRFRVGGLGFRVWGSGCGV